MEFHSSYLIPTSVYLVRFVLKYSFYFSAYRIAAMSSPDGQLPPQPVDLPRRLVAEGIGTAFLLATVVGSGIMGARSHVLDST